MHDTVPIINILKNAQGVRELGYAPPEHQPDGEDDDTYFEDTIGLRSSRFHINDFHDRNAPKPLTDNQIQEMGELVQERGLAALAFYLPYHNSPRHWGIYYYDPGLSYLSTIMQPCDPNWGWVTSIRFLYSHEIFHCRSEMAFSQIEAASGSSYYAATRAERPYNMMEEALANAHALRRREFNRKHVRKFMLRQPKGYRDFGPHTNNFEGGLNDFVLRYASNVVCGSVYFDVGQQNISLRCVPEYRITCDSLAISDLAFLGSPAAVVETATLRDSLGKHQMSDHWEKQVRIMREVGLFHPGLQFKKYKGVGGVFTIRLNRQYRVACTMTGAVITAHIAGTHKDMDTLHRKHLE